MSLTLLLDDISESVEIGEYVGVTHKLSSSKSEDDDSKSISPQSISLPLTTLLCIGPVWSYII